ncbi:MAG: hypothetical protein OXM55_00485 [Bdellovibrionales bacterium]|nr:hypothetical protein [Bdellovibrionales bacterium]
MKIQERSFSGKIFRPKPKCYLSSNKKLMTAITPWGQEAADTQDLFENIETQYNFLSEDKESTQPFPKLMSLTPIENDMRTTIIQINQNIFDKINQEEYAMGFELFFATVVGNILTFIQIGQPVVLIDQPHQYLRSIGQTVTPPLNHKTLSPQKRGTAHPPLPYQLLGIHEDISFHPFFFRFQSEDRLILLNRNVIPAKWFYLKREERTVDKLSQLAAEDNPHIPFWLGIIDLMDPT